MKKAYRLSSIPSLAWRVNIVVPLGQKGLESRRGNSTEFNQRLSALNKLGGKSKKRLVLLYPANISVYCQIHM